MAMILDFFVAYFVEKLTTMAEDEVAMLLGVPAEINALRRRLSSLQNFLVDAERRQFREPEIKSWLNQLREVVYDADDILDEYVIETERLEVGSLPPSSKLSARFFHRFHSCFATCGLRHSLGNSIKQLNLRLKFIDRSKLDISLTRGSSPSTSRASDHRRNGSHMSEPVVVRTTSIDSDTRMLVNWLLKPSHEKNVLVYVIAGMGGIGKTTLAWEIFQHEMIQASFSQIRPVWVCVSKDYEPITLLNMIIKGFEGEPGEFQNLHDLQNKLRQLVAGKKFFLVLDDVWNVEVWDNLLKPCLWSAAPGSRILVTTRNIAVSRRMDAERCHQVQKLSREDSWSLLCKMVFRDGDERLKQNLKNIGMSIVDRCDGLPLALATIGGVLRGRDLIQAEWEKVAGDSAWSFEQPEEIEGTSNQVMGAVYLSYEELPPQIKQCFVYCAMFPEDYILRQDLLVPLWIAEGFIEPRKNSLMEDTAEKYWKHLVERSLLQAVPGYYDQGGYKMHDVVRSLALYLAQDECYSGDVRGFVDETATATWSSPKRRRVLIHDGEGASVPDVIKEPTCLRTIIFLDTPLLRQVPGNFFRKFTCLRVLDLSGAPNSKLPDAIQHLIHLRYLNLSRSQITEIPDTIRRLRNLQFLGLAGCTELQILSGAIGDLRNLRALDVDGTKLEGMPKGIRKLQRLSRLVGFRVNGNAHDVDSSKGQDGRQRSPSTWCTLEELESLTQLKFLVIQNLERISSRDEAERVELSRKSHLDDLRLICNQAPGAIIDAEKRRIIKEVFDRLCPPSRLQRLKIGGYFGLEYPGWMKGGSISWRLPDLKHLELIDCFLCRTLPPLGLLPHLEILHISGASAVKSIGNEFLVSDAGQAHQHLFPAFPRLKHLILKNMSGWQKWWWKGEQDRALLPRLEEVVIERCGKLMSLPKGLLHNVTRLTIEDASSVIEIGNLPSVRTLNIVRSGLGRIYNLPALENLTIVDCSRLRDMEKIGELQYLKLQDQAMGALPNWFLIEKEGQEPLHSFTSVVLNAMFARSGRQGFVGVRKLEFVCSIQLLQRCIKDGPDWPKIQGIPYVKGYTMDKSKYISYDKSNLDSDFETNIDEGDVTINGTKKGGSDSSPTLSINILLLLVVGVAKLAFDYKSCLLPFLSKAVAAIPKFK